MTPPPQKGKKKKKKNEGERRCSSSSSTGGTHRATSKRHKHHCNGVIHDFWVLTQMFAGFANEVENGVKIIMFY